MVKANDDADHGRKDNKDNKDIARQMAEALKGATGPLPQFEDKAVEASDVVEAYLQKKDWKYQRLEQAGGVVFVLSFGSDRDDGVTFDVRVICYRHLVSCMMTCPPDEHVATAEQTDLMSRLVCKVAYSVSGLSPVFDPSDGEWGCRAHIPHVVDDREFDDMLRKLQQLYLCLRNAWQRISSGDTEWQALAMASLTTFHMVTALCGGRAHGLGSLLRLLQELEGGGSDDGSDSSGSDDGSAGNDPEDDNGPDAADR